MYPRFGLILMANHACNLRCGYCYSGAKFARGMTAAIAERSIARAVASLQSGGTLELTFFGGEPLLEAPLLLHCIEIARARCTASNTQLSLSMTTNGTIDTPQAWRVMSDPLMQVSISHDGLPGNHDRHRVDADGRGSHAAVENTIRRLVEQRAQFQVITVVRPDTVESLPESLAHLRGLGVDLVLPSLDLWTAWSKEDLARLEESLEKCADYWRANLPAFGVSWFNEKAVELAGVPMGETARCGFGDGEIAVAPSGNLYPCERLIGEDRADNRMRLAGHALDGGGDFLTLPGCAMAGSGCGLSCSCSNFIRSGSTDLSDDLLRTLDQICMRATRRVLVS